MTYTGGAVSNDPHDNPFVDAWNDQGGTGSERQALSPVGGDVVDLENTDPGLVTVQARHARVMSDEQVEELRRSQRLRLKKVQQFVTVLLNAGKTLRLYSKERSNIDRFIDSMLGALEEEFEHEPHLTLDITPRAITWEGNVVFENKEQRANLAFKLYSDGVRVIQFRLGITDAEIKEFVELVAREGVSNGLADQDISFLFWEGDFKHIHLSIAETFIDDDSEEALELLNALETSAAQFLGAFGLDMSGEIIAEALPDEGDQAPLSMRRPTTRSVGLGTGGEGAVEGPGGEGAGLGGGKHSPDRGVRGGGRGWKANDDLNLPNLPPETLDEKAMEAVYQGLVGIEQAYASFEEVGAVVAEVVFAEEDPAQLKLLLDHLDQALNPLLTTASLVPINAILRRLALLVRVLPQDNAHHLAIAGLLLRVGKQDRLMLLSDSLNNEWQDSWKGELFTFISLQHPDNVDEVLGFLREVARLPARRAIVDALVLLAGSEPDVFLPLLRSSNWHLVADGIAALGRIGDPTSLDRIISTYDREEHQIREEVLLALRPHQSPRISALMTSALKDSDSDVRLSALRYLAVYNVRDSVETLEQQMSARGFGKRSYDERKGWYMAYGHIARRRAWATLEKEAQSLVAKKEAGEHLRLVLMGIKSTRLPIAQSFLEGLAKSGPTDIRLAAHHILSGS